MYCMIEITIPSVFKGDIGRADTISVRYTERQKTHTERQRRRSHGNEYAKVDGSYGRKRRD